MNLLSKLHKNSILTGPIDSYCLACGCLLRSEEESYAHIHQPHHVDKLQALPQLDSYKDDCIIKIKEGYFCPYCNIILPTIKRISLHVVEPNHQENKIAQSISRHADTIFLFDIVVIDPRSWHGVDGTTCSVCNEDYSDEKEHTTEPAHALKLIQAKCEFGDNYVYRNVDEDLFFCLICKYILPITDKESHSNSDSHKELYKKSSTEGAAIKSNKSSELNNNIAAEKNDNTLPEVKPDSKDTGNNPKKQVTSELDNGSSRVVDDDRGAVETDPQEFSSNKVNYNTEKPQTQAPKTEPTNTTQDTAKVQTQVPKTEPTRTTQDTAKAQTQVPKTESTNTTQDTAKPQTQVPKTEPTNTTQDTAKVQTQVPKTEPTNTTQDTAKVQTQVPKTEPTNTTQDTAKVQTQVPKTEPTRTTQDTAKAQTQVPKTESTNTTQDTAKAQTQVPKTESTNTTHTAKVQTQVPKTEPTSTTQDTAKAQTQVPKTESTTTTHTAKVQTQVPKTEPTSTTQDTAKAQTQVPKSESTNTTHTAKVQTQVPKTEPTNTTQDTAKVRTQVPQTEPTNITQDTAKVSTHIRETLKQEAPKITLLKVIQEAQIDSKSNEDTSKVNEKVKNQNNDTQKKSTRDLKKVQESKDSNEKAQETTKNIEVKTKEHKDTAASIPNVPKAKVTEPVKPASVKSDTNGTAKGPRSAEPHLYEFLKSVNFVIRTIDGQAFCTLCDLSIDLATIGYHCDDKHHSKLYQKHIARKNKLSEKNGPNTANIKKEANIEIATGKENTVPVTEKTKAQEATSKVDKPVAAFTNNVGKEAKVVDESTDKNNHFVQKEVLTPENKVGDERISASQPTPEPKNVPAQKSTKKAQKKAAKARAVLHTQQSKLDEAITNNTGDMRDTALDDASVTVNAKTIETNVTSVTVNRKAIETNETSVTVNGKAIETNETSVTVTAKATETNETSVTVTEKPTETSETTRNNDPENVNGTTNNPILTFIKTISQVDSSPEDVVINCKYVVGNLSFVLLVRTGHKVECVACNETLTDEVHKHISTEEHMIKFEDCPVVTCLDDEFIRQVQREKYHCGFCNLTLPDWEETKAHLETYRHSDAKTSASWRLDRYLPHMKQCEKKEVRSVLTAVFRQTME